MAACASPEMPGGHVLAQPATTISLAHRQDTAAGDLWACSNMRKRSLWSKRHAVGTYVVDVVVAVVLVGGGVVGDDEGVRIHKGGLDRGAALGSGQDSAIVGAWHVPPGSTASGQSAAEVGL